MERDPEAERTQEEQQGELKDNEDQTSKQDARVIMWNLNSLKNYQPLLEGLTSLLCCKSLYNFHTIDKYL